MARAPAPIFSAICGRTRITTGDGSIGVSSAPPSRPVIFLLRRPWSGFAQSISAAGAVFDDHPMLGDLRAQPVGFREILVFARGHALRHQLVNGGLVDARAEPFFGCDIEQA